MTGQERRQLDQAARRCRAQGEDAPALAAWMRHVEDCPECGRVRLGDLPSPDGCQDGDRLFGQMLLEGRF